MKENITAAVLFIMALSVFILSIRSFREKGFLLNNAYLYASKREREEMDKSPHYRQTAVVFLLIGFLFLFNGFAVLWSIDWMPYVIGAILIATLIYAVVSTLKIKK